MGQWKALKLDQKHMMCIMAVITFAQVVIGIVDICYMMVQPVQYTHDFCSGTWGYKSFAMDLQVVLSLFYMHFVKKSIEDPMLHNHKKEIMYSIISVVIAFVLSLKAYDVKCMYLEEKSFR